MERIIYDSQSYCNDRDYIRDEIFINQNDGRFSSKEEITEDDINDEISIMQAIEWQDEKARLEETFNDTSRTFILRGTCGLWYGRVEGGKIINSYDELSEAWQKNDEFKIYDKNGLFSIKSIHHDGTNLWTVKELTEKGKKYLSRHEGEVPDRILHEKLFSSPYSRNIHFADTYYGAYKSKKSA